MLSHTLQCPLELASETRGPARNPPLSRGPSDAAHSTLSSSAAPGSTGTGALKMVASYATCLFSGLCAALLAVAVAYYLYW